MKLTVKIWSKLVQKRLREWVWSFQQKDQVYQSDQIGHFFWSEKVQKKWSFQISLSDQSSQNDQSSQYDQGSQYDKISQHDKNSQSDQND